MFVKVMLIFILMVNTLTSPRRIEQFTWLIVAATAYIAFRAVFDYARGINLIENGRVQGAVGGMFRNPNDLALNLVAVIPLAISLALRRIAVVARVVAVGCVVVMLGAIVATQSRSGTVGLAAMVLVVGVHLVRRKPGLLLAGAMVMVLALPLLPSSYWERLSSITDASRDQTGSREARSILLRESLATFLSHPLTGVGAGQFKNYNPEQREEAWRETHNVVLQVASELGIVGLAVFAFLVGRAAYAPVQTRRLLRRAAPLAKPRRKSSATPDLSRPVAVVTAQEHEMLDAHSAAMTAAIVGWFVCALFASVAYHWTFYYLLALAAAPRDLIADRLMPPRRTRRKAPAATVAVMEARA
jgi:O-antigen ligase